MPDTAPALARRYCGAKDCWTLCHIRRMCAGTRSHLVNEVLPSFYHWASILAVLLHSHASLRAAPIYRPTTPHDVVVGEAYRVLFPLAAVRPSRLVVLAILIALSLAQVSPTPSIVHGATGTAPRWTWPVIDPHPVVRPFVAPATEYSAGHRGIDIGAASGSFVVAPEDGVVFFVGFVVDRPVLSIAHADGIISSYEPLTSDLTVGDVVRRGEPIGTLIAGHCTSACLHLGARLHGGYVSPLTYLGGIKRAVLLPLRGSG